MGPIKRERDANAQAVSTIRSDLPEQIRLWIGGPGAATITAPSGVEQMGNLEEFERRVALLGFEKSGP